MHTSLMEEIYNSQKTYSFVKFDAFTPSHQISILLL